MHFFFCETDICIQMQKTWWKSLLHVRQNILNPAPVQWIVYIQLQERDEAIAGSINKSVCQASKDMCWYCVAPLGCRHSRDDYINRRKAIKWNSRLTSMLKLKKNIPMHQWNTGNHCPALNSWERRKDIHHQDLWLGKPCYWSRRGN